MASATGPWRSRAVLGVLLLGACSSDGDGAAALPLLTANGTVLADGRTIVPSHGAANVIEQGTINVMFSDVPMGCATLTQSALPDGTYVQVDVPSATPGPADKHLIVIKLVTADGVGGCGSTAGAVQVLDASDTALTLRVAYEETLDDGTFAVNGDFGVVRCP